MTSRKMSFFFIDCAYSWRIYIKSLMVLGVTFDQRGQLQFDIILNNAKNQFMKKRILPMLFKKIFFTTVAAAIIQTLVAQPPLATPQDLKVACENSPGNIVMVNQSSTVSLPIYPSVPLQINCPCTIVLGNEATLAFELSNIQFAGPFTVQSAGKGEVKVIKSSIKSPSVSFSLGGNNSSLSTSESLLQALTGNISVTLGELANMELYGRLSSSTAYGLLSAGVISINAGPQFSGSITDIGISGTQGIQIGASGFEPKLKAENVSLLALQGSVEIIANSPKGTLEMMETDFRFQNSANIHFGGEDASLKIAETTFWGPTYDIPATGGITIVAGSGNANNTKIEMVEVIARNINGNFSVTSSVDAEKGNVKMEKSAMTINGELIFRTGRLGSTEVKENALRSSTKITIQAGMGGSCISQPNRILEAPVIEACSPSSIARINTTKEIEMGFSIFPNPGDNGRVNIRFKNMNGPQDIILTDASGKTIRQWREYRNNMLTVDQLRAGYYNLQARSKITGEKNSGKFIVVGY
jgi:hypothetical protein